MMGGLSWSSMKKYIKKKLITISLKIWNIQSNITLPGLRIIIIRNSKKKNWWSFKKTYLRSKIKTKKTNG